MTEPDKLIKLNKIEKEIRERRFEDSLKQREYYCEIEELFDPLTKILNTHGETWQSYNEILRKNVKSNRLAKSTVK